MSEVASMLRVAPKAVHGLCDAGCIKPQSVSGGTSRFSVNEINGFLAQRSNESKGAVPYRVLVVDDDRGVNGLIVEQLSGWLDNVEILSAYDGFDAGVQIKQFNPDVIILDLMMPGLDGFDLCRMLKQDDITKHIKIVAMTGHLTPMTKKQILGLGADICLGKPYSVSDLLDACGIEVPESSQA